MKRLLVIVGIVVSSVIGYAAIHLAVIEVGREIVVVHRRTPDGEVSPARLWIVDDGEVAWVHNGDADTPWIRHLADEPILEIERGGETLRFRGIPDRSADPRVHRLLREKYGAADRLVRFWAGTDTETGVVTGDTCRAVPVRLEPATDGAGP